MRGTVKFFNETKGWGFITGEDGADYFVHMSGIKPTKMSIFFRDEIHEVERERIVPLLGDQSVEFDVVDAERGKQAVNVVVIDADDCDTNTDTESKDKEDK